MNSITDKLAWTVVVGAIGFLFLGTVAADVPLPPPPTFDDPNEYGYPPPCDEYTESLGSFRIGIHCDYWALFWECPEYDPDHPELGGVEYRTEFPYIGLLLHSPTLYDPNTVIGRSAPHLHCGSPSCPGCPDCDGTPVGSTGTIISDADLEPACAAFQGPPDTREVHTEIASVIMDDWFAGGAHTGTLVQIGNLAFPWLPISPGEIESKQWDDPPNPWHDFPAESCFKVYAEIDLPPCGSFDGATVGNNDYMEVNNDDLPSFPPIVVYIHGGTAPVPVLFRTPDPNPSHNPPWWNVGDRLGWIVLGGHGVGYGVAEMAAFSQAVDDETEMEMDRAAEAESDLCRGDWMHYPQLPDHGGWDVHATWPVVVADDWKAGKTGELSHIRFWGSWKDGSVDGVITSFKLNIHANIPADQSPTGYSIPDVPALWEYDANSFAVTPVNPVSSGGWYNPVTGEQIAEDHEQYYRYDIDIPAGEDRFLQTEDTIYWLKISAVVANPPRKWGRRSSVFHWKGRGVWAIHPSSNWVELDDPPGPLDLAFVITGDDSPGACCLPNHACDMLDPVSCEEEGGNRYDGWCSAMRACCLPDGGCIMADPVCCELDLGGSESQYFDYCLGDIGGNGINDACEDPCAAGGAGIGCGKYTPIPPQSSGNEKEVSPPVGTPPKTPSELDR